MVYELPPWRVLDKGNVITPLSRRPTAPATATLWCMGQLAAALSRTISPWVVSALLPFVLLWCSDTETQMLPFLSCATLEFKHVRKDRHRDPHLLKYSGPFKAECVLLFLFSFFFFFSDAVGFRTKITPWPFTRQTVHCAQVFQCCCPPSITMVCCTSNNIYHLVIQSVATGLMKRSFVILHKSQSLRNQAGRCLFTELLLSECAQSLRKKCVKLVSLNSA